MDYSFLKQVPGALVKPPSRKTLKGRKDRKEAAVKKDVRAAVVERDGYCRFGPGQSDELYQMLGSCDGVSEHAHLEDKRRGRTRGMEPEERHTTGTTAMMCKRHHVAYDGGEFYGAYRTARMANGPMVWFARSMFYVEGI